MSWHRIANAVGARLDPSRTEQPSGVSVQGLRIAGAFDQPGERKTWVERSAAAAPVRAARCGAR